MNLNESQIIDLIKNIFRPILASGAKDLLDDGAELPPCPPGYTRVVSLDAFQEHNDFKIGLGPLESAGHRAITQNLSDLAAMGAKPIGFLWSLELPSSWLENNALYLTQFCTGALKVCQENKLEFYGGDLSASKSHFSCAITIFGDVLGRPLGRQGARPGDKIYVSRELVDWAANPYPRAELKLGQELVGLATACMDISDGLAKDLARLCKASGVGAKIHTVPNHAEATREQALYGGEDYALLYTTQESKLGIEIGEITKAPQILIKNLEGYETLKPGGFDHFKSTILS
ncbi:MAG: AIR synthase related protein [Myxococcaceae bacterium]